MKRRSILFLAGSILVLLAGCLLFPEVDPVLIKEDFTATSLDQDLWKVVLGGAENQAEVVSVGEERKLALTGVAVGTDLPRVDTRTDFAADTAFIMVVDVEIPDVPEGGNSYTAVARIDPYTANRPEVWQVRFQNKIIRLAGHKVEDDAWGIINANLGPYELGRTYRILVESKSNGDARFTVTCLETEQVVVNTDWYRFSTQWVNRPIAFRLCLNIGAGDPERTARFDNLLVQRASSEE